MDMSLVKRIFSSIPELETERLLLRKMKRADAEDMYEYSKNPEVTRYLLWMPHPSVHYTARYLNYLQDRYSVGKFYDWALVDKSTGKMIGTCGFTCFHEEHNSAECGYVLNPEYWGRGIAAEALGAVMKFGFMTLGLHRIECRYMKGNDRSRRVMEKVGMTFEGMMRDSILVGDKYRTVGVCAILAEEYIKNTYGTSDVRQLR